MARVTGETVIRRPVDEVFDYVADERHEPSYNPRMVHAELATPGPVGQGTKFVALMASRPRPMQMVTELTGYERPRRLESRTTAGPAEVRGSLSFDPVPEGTRMRWSWEVHPHGMARLLGPVIGWVGRRQEAEIWAGLKWHLESEAGRGQDSATPRPPLP